MAQQQQQQLHLLSGIPAEALLLLEQELNAQQPSVARASIIMGLLQERLFGNNCEEPLAPAVELYMAKFQAELVAPAAAKLAPKLKKPQDRVIAIAKFLRGKLAKAPAHKQPLHTQYLPSALRDSGKRQLDCLGIATAVLGLCHAISAQHTAQHADLAACTMVVSDDHCWLAVPPHQQQQHEGPAAAIDSSQSQQQLVQVEVTDPRELTAAHMANWLYAGGQWGQRCSAQQVVLLLVAGLMPEEVKEQQAAAALADVQMALLTRLAAGHPSALFYSNFFRWGMLHEQQELEQLVAAAESRSMGELQQLALLGPQQLQSQQDYAESVRRCSTMWHPHSCATFCWLNRMQAALCGDTDELLALSRPCQDNKAAAAAPDSSAAADPASGATTAAAKVQQEKEGAAKQAEPLDLQQQQQQPQAARRRFDDCASAWLQLGASLFEQALLSLGGCTAVLRQYGGCAGKPDRSADKQLMEAVRDLWQNLSDACKAMACLQSMAGQEAGQQQDRLLQQDGTTAPQQVAAPAAVSAARPDSQAGSSSGTAGAQGGQLGAGVPAAHTAHNMHLAAAVSHAQAVPSMHCSINNSSLLRPLLQFMDAICSFFGDESADLPAEVVADFIAAAGAFTPAARLEAVSQAAAGQLHSNRVRALAEVGSAAACAWQELAPDLQQLLQMPGSRKRKRKEL